MPLSADVGESTGANHQSQVLLHRLRCGRLGEGEKVLPGSQGMIGR
jgi:hypothetical protein